MQTVRLKLIMLLALHAPGGSDEAEPWRGLRTVLADISGLIAGETHS